MCILIVKKSGAAISDGALRNSYDNNPDGCGFAYVNSENGENKLIIEKGLFPFTLFLSKFREAEQRAPESNFIIHFRISTSGGVITENCHPFYLNDNVAYAHNGILTTIPRTDFIGSENDTRAFGRLVLSKLFEQDPNFHSSGAVRFILQEYLGRNKIALLNSDNEFTIFGESMGEWVDNVWYSNASYKTIKYSGNQLPYSGYKVKEKVRYTKGNKLTIHDTGVFIFSHREKKDRVGAIVAPYTMTLSKVIRFFRTNTTKEMIDNQTLYWEDTSGTFCDKDELEDAILTLYLDGGEYFCPSCNMLLEKKDIDTIHRTIVCSYCKRFAYEIKDDMLQNAS